MDEEKEKINESGTKFGWKRNYGKLYIKEGYNQTKLSLNKHFIFASGNTLMHY